MSCVGSGEDGGGREDGAAQEENKLSFEFVKRERERRSCNHCVIENSRSD